MQESRAAGCKRKRFSVEQKQRMRTLFESYGVREQGFSSLTEQERDFFVDQVNKSGEKQVFPPLGHTALFPGVLVCLVPLAAENKTLHLLGQI